MGATSNLPEPDPFARLRSGQDAPNPEVLARLQRTIGQEPPARRALSRRARLGLSGLFLFLALVWTAQRALQTKPAALLSLGVGASVLLGFVLLRKAAPGTVPRASLGVRRGLLATLLVGLLGTLLAMTGHWDHLEPETFSRMSRCTWHVLLTSTVATGLLLTVWRGTDPFKPTLLGGLLGAMGGMIGALGVGLTCASVEGFHLLISHGATVTIMSALGAVVGRRVLTP